MIESIFHVNVNVTNFERSIEFYKLFGFKMILDLGVVGSAKLSEGMRLPNGRARAVLMILGDNPRATRLDLIEWRNPQTEGQAYATPSHAGICRIALRTRTLEKDYEELKAKGVEFWTEPKMVEVRDGRQEGFVCCSDPDGTLIELIQV